MSHTTSFHKAATRMSLLATAVLSGLLAFSDLPTLTSRLTPAGVEQNRPAVTAENEVNGAVVLAVALAGSAAIGVGLTALVEHEQTQHRPPRAASHRLSARHAPVPSSGLSFTQVSRPLQQKILRLLHHDRGAAHRLFVHANLKYPGKAPDWYAEKILYDLVRDRGKN